MSHASHTAASASGDRRALILAGLLTGAYFAVELGLGFWTGSVAVTSDAFHTFSAVGGVLIALVAQRLSERSATAERTFGWGRAEIVGALFNGLFLVIMAGYVMYIGAMQLMDPEHLSTTTMLFAAAGGIATEVVAFGLLYERQKGNLNMRGAFWHIIQTFVGSLIIIVSALVIRFTDFMEIDPILGMAFGLVLFWASWDIIRSSLNILLESTPEGLDLEAAIAQLRSLDGVKDVHHVHAWVLTSGRNVFSAHIQVRSLAGDGQRVLQAASGHLKEHFNIYFSTLQLEEHCLSAEHDATDIDITAGAAQTTPGERAGHAAH